MGWFGPTSGAAARRSTAGRRPYRWRGSLERGRVRVDVGGPAYGQLTPASAPSPTTRTGGSPASTARPRPRRTGAERQATRFNSSSVVPTTAQQSAPPKPDRRRWHRTRRPPATPPAGQVDPTVGIDVSDGKALLDAHLIVTPGPQEPSPRIDVEPTATAAVRASYQEVRVRYAVAYRTLVDLMV
jgi:hypothetical protein